jgi:predicted nicotinamide N-methyase
MADAAEDCLDSVGFMFDAHHSKVKLMLTLHNNISVQLKTIGTDPGHKQSGQYLWPAATDLSNHLIDNWSSLHSSIVCELGAGCGLVGIIAILLGVSEVIFTDYDMGSLTLIEGNYTLLLMCFTINID